MVYCSIHGLKQKQATEYINKDAGLTLDVDTVGRRLREFNSEQNTNQWLMDYTRIGYLLEQKKSVDVLTTLREHLMEELHFLKERLAADREAKNDVTTKMNELSTLAQAIIKADERIEDLRLGTPIIAQLKKKLEESNNGKEIKAELPKP